MTPEFATINWSDIRAPLKRVRPLRPDTVRRIVRLLTRALDAAAVKPPETPLSPERKLP